MKSITGQENINVGELTTEVLVVGQVYDGYVARNFACNATSVSFGSLPAGMYLLWLTWDGNIDAGVSAGGIFTQVIPGTQGLFAPFVLGSSSLSVTGGNQITVTTVAAYADAKWTLSYKKIQNGW